MSDVSIKEAFQRFMADANSALTDPTAIAPSAPSALLSLGALNSLIQSVEMLFISYHVVRCESDIDIDDFEEIDHTHLLYQPYRKFEDRIRDLKRIDPNSKLTDKLFGFSHFRNWAAHNMSATFLPIQFNEKMAQSSIPLINAMVAYCKAIANLIQKDLEEWAISKLPDHHENFTEDQMNEMEDEVKNLIKGTIPNLILLPPQVNKPLAEFGLWPYDSKPGNHDVLLFLREDDEEVMIHVGPIPENASENNKET